MSDEWDWFDSLPGDAQDEVNDLRHIARVVAESDPETTRDHGLTTECAWCHVRRVWPDSPDKPFLPHAEDCIWILARKRVSPEPQA